MEENPEYSTKFKKDLAKFVNKELETRQYCRVYADFKNCPYLQKDKKACKNCADRVTVNNNNKII